MSRVTEKWGSPHLYTCPMVRIKADAMYTIYASLKVTHVLKQTLCLVPPKKEMIGKEKEKNNIENHFP